jgi:hypothetical protein
MWQIMHIRFLQRLPELIGYVCNNVLRWECLSTTAFSLFSGHFCYIQRASAI